MNRTEEPDDSITLCFKERICCLIRHNPKRFLAWSWGASMLLVIGAFIAACAAAQSMTGVGGPDSTKAGTRAVEFTAVWTALVILGLMVVGTYAMRKFNSPLGMGVLLGLVFVISSQMLILFAIFVDHAKKDAAAGDIQSSQAENGFAALSFLLFLIYAIYCTILAVFRKDIVDAIRLSAQEDDDNTSQKQPDQI